jgi:hypothetical protein
MLCVLTVKTKLATCYGNDLELAFRKFHAANPQVYEMLRALALHYVRRTKNKMRVIMLYECARWELSVNSPRTFVMYKRFQFIYAQFLMDQEPELAGMLWHRTRRGAA